MSKNKEWASHIEPVALADILGVPVLVTTNSNDEDQYQVWVYPKNVKTEESDATWILRHILPLLQP